MTTSPSAPPADVPSNLLIKTAAGLVEQHGDLRVVTDTAEHIENALDYINAGLGPRGYQTLSFAKTDYTAAQRREFANRGVAQQDGSFPVANEADLHNAVRLVGHAQDPEAAKTHIISRAKAMGLTSALPSDWDAGDDANESPDRDAKPKNSQPNKPARKSLIEKIADIFSKAVEEDAATDDADPSDLTGTLAVTKSAPELRYTLGPVYLPDSIDAHGEWASAADLQKAVWSYVEKTGGDRTIYLQHSDKPAGKWVEIACIPNEFSAPMVKAVDGVAKSEPTTFPAGTPFMGVRWDSWAWDMIKSGELTGFSIGGTARRIEADLA